MAAYLPGMIRTRKPKLQFQGPIGPLLDSALKPWLDANPALRRVASFAVTADTNRKIRSIGIDLVTAWRTEAYPGIAKQRITAFRARYRADRIAVLQRLQTLNQFAA